MSDPSATPSEPRNVDSYVGQKVRERRKQLGMSQTDLADAIGLTFQQVQKYERGTNRISASKLYDIGVTLKVPPYYFFNGFDETDHDEAIPAAEQGVHDFLKTVEGQELAAVFPRIRSSRQRRKIVELVQSIVQSD